MQRQYRNNQDQDWRYQKGKSMIVFAVLLSLSKDNVDFDKRWQ